MAIGYTAGGQDVYTPNISESGSSGTSGVTMEEVLERMYPVGSVILRYDEEDPNVYLSVGTWTRLNWTGFIAIASSTPDYKEGVGLTLTEENLPAHTHDITIDSTGSHTHTATVSEAGDHTHTASSASAGAHTHTITVDNAGEHTHTTATSYNNNQTAAGTDYTRVVANGSESASNVVSIGNAGEHTHAASSESAGAHTHTITNDEAGAHTHTVTNASAGSHTHTATASETGGGEILTVSVNSVNRLELSVWYRES